VYDNSILEITFFYRTECYRTMPLNITTENPHYALLESEQPYGPSYGVQYLTPTGHFMQVEDISCDRIFVEKMVELFNLCELPPERLYRIIEHLLP